MINVYLDNDSIVRSPYVGQKTSLVLTYKGLDIRLDLIGYKFGDDLVLSITQANRSKVLQSGGIPTFRDEKGVGRILTQGSIVVV